MIAGENWQVVPGWCRSLYMASAVVCFSGRSDFRPELYLCLKVCKGPLRHVDNTHDAPDGPASMKVTSLLNILCLPLSVALAMPSTEALSAPVPEACLPVDIGTIFEGDPNLPMDFYVLGDNRFFLSTVQQSSPAAGVWPSELRTFDRNGQIIRQFNSRKLFESQARKFDSYSFRGHLWVLPSADGLLLASRTRGHDDKHQGYWGTLFSQLSEAGTPLMVDHQTSIDIEPPFFSGYSLERQQMFLRHDGIPGLHSREHNAEDFARFTIRGVDGLHKTLDLTIYRQALEKVGGRIKGVIVSNGFSTVNGKYLLWGYLFGPSNAHRVTTWITHFDEQGQVEWLHTYKFDTGQNNATHPENQLAKAILDPYSKPILLPDGGFILQSRAHYRVEDEYSYTNYARVSAEGKPLFAGQLQRPHVADSDDLYFGGRPVASATVSALSDGRILTLESNTVNVLEGMTGAVLQTLPLPALSHTILPTQQDKLPNNIYVAGMDTEKRQPVLMSCSP